MELSTDALRDFLNTKSQQYNHPNFIASDPIQIPKQFDTKEDIEIAGFLSAIIAWGNRASIIKSASNIMHILGDQPYDYIMNSTAADWKAIDHFVHRTFNLIDLRYCLHALQHLYNIMVDCMEPYTQKQTNHLWMMPLGDSEIFFLKSITPNELPNTSPTQPEVLPPNEFICFCDGW